MTQQHERMHARRLHVRLTSLIESEETLDDDAAIGREWSKAALSSPRVVQVPVEGTLSVGGDLATPPAPADDDADAGAAPRDGNTAVRTAMSPWTSRSRYC